MISPIRSRSPTVRPWTWSRSPTLACMLIASRGMYTRVLLTVIVGSGAGRGNRHARSGVERPLQPAPQRRVARRPLAEYLHLAEVGGDMHPDQRGARQARYRREVQLAGAEDAGARQLHLDALGDDDLDL